MIEHISFDFWNTIGKSNPKFSEAKHNFLLELKPDYDKQVVSNIKHKVEGFEHPFNYMESVMGRTWRHVKGIGYDEFRDELIYLFKKYPPILNENVLCLVEDFKKGYNLTISITSNTVSYNGSILESLCGNGFDFYVFNDRAGYDKPDPRIFHEVHRYLTACRKEYIPYSNILHIGDNKDQDEGALSVGMKFVNLDFEALSKITSSEFRKLLSLE